MEQDRYHQNHTMYIVGILFLVLSMSLLAFTLYLLPALLLKWRYHIPEFVLQLKFWLQLKQGYSESAASWVIFLGLLSLGGGSAVVAYFASNTIENQIYGITQEAPKETEQTREEVKKSISLLFKILFFVMLALIGLSFLEWMLATAPPAS